MKRIKLIAKHDFLILLIVFIFGLCNFFWGEVIPANGGLGYDGTTYASIVKNFPMAVFEKGLDAYRVGRILPSGIVWSGLSVLQKPLTNYKILTAYRLYNLGLIVLASLAYVLIARELKFNIRTRWLGFIGLFLNVAVAKHFFYYPVATDQTAFVLGLLLLYFFLKNNKIGLLITTILGSFTWPLMMYYGVFLYIFPKKAIEKEKAGARLILPFSILFVCGLLILFIKVYNDEKTIGLLEAVGAAQVVDSVIYLSMLTVLAYIFYGLKIALDNIGFPSFQSILKSTSASRFVVGLLVLILVTSIVSLLTDDPGVLSIQWFLEGIALNSIVRPFGSLVANVIYYGPVLLLTLFLWKPFIQIVRQHGLGLSFFIVGNFFLSINAESRMLMPTLPFFVVFTALATQELKWKASIYWFLGIVSFLFSKIWLLMNTTEPMTGVPLQFPLQYIFMNHGPWMSNQMYVIQGIFVLVTGVIVFMLIKYPCLLDNKDVLPE
jgi:hypothetical protein